MASEFEVIKKSLMQARQHAKNGGGGGVVVYEPVDIKGLRRKLDMTQTEFAGALNISVDTLQHWERGDRQPRGPAKALLRAVANNPKAVLRALGAK